MEPIYDDLSNPDLLLKCLHGKTQNPNENLHKLIWDHAIKEVFVSKRVVEQAALSAVAHFNDGSAALIKILELMGVPPRHFTIEGCKRKDSRRLACAKSKSSDSGKRRRKQIRAAKKGFMDKKVQEEGPTYEKGGF